MRIDWDILTIGCCVLALSGVGAFVLYWFLGVNFYIAAPATLTLTGIPTWMLMRAASRPLTPSKKRTDPAIGEIEYHKAGFWQGRLPGAALGENVLMFIDADEGGPSEQQRDLCREIGARYSTLRPQIETALTKHYGQLLQSVDDEELPRFCNPSISIPRSENPTDWSIEFSTVPAGNLEHTVVFRDWQVVDVYSGD